jgi:hypothetical protein
MSISEQFYDKISGEYDAFIDRLKAKTPDEILVAAYEKVSKEEIVIAFENSFYGDDEYTALMKHDNLLDELYMDWLDTDSADMEHIGTLISNLVERDMGRDTPTHESHNENGDYPLEEHISTAFAAKTYVTAETINGAVGCGDWVIAVTEKEYAGLIGQVIAIDKLGTGEHETDNPGDDIHVDFTRVNYQADEIQTIEANFANLYGEHKSYSEIPLDDVIMAPEMLISLVGRDIEPTNELMKSYADVKEHANQRLSIDFENREKTLIARIEQNYADFKQSLDGFSKSELIDMAATIHAWSDAWSYTTAYHYFNDDELQFYSKFVNPLEVVADAWRERNVDIDDMSYSMEFVYEQKDQHLTQYALITDAVSDERFPEIREMSTPEAEQSAFDKALSRGKEKSEAYKSQKSAEPNKTNTKREEIE